MIDRQGAIAILQEHINTYCYQTTDKDGSKWYALELSETRCMKK